MLPSGAASMEKDNQAIANKRKMGSAVDVRSTRKAVRETLVNWARKIPGFNELKNEDQVCFVDCFSNVSITLLKKRLFGAILLILLLCFSYL